MNTLFTIQFHSVLIFRLQEWHTSDTFFRTLTYKCLIFREPSYLVRRPSMLKQHRLLRAVTFQESHFRKILVPVKEEFLLSYRWTMRQEKVGREDSRTQWQEMKVVGRFEQIFWQADFEKKKKSWQSVYCLRAELWLAESQWTPTLPVTTWPRNCDTMIMNTV